MSAPQSESRLRSDSFQYSCGAPCRRVMRGGIRFVFTLAAVAEPEIHPSLPVPNLLVLRRIVPAMTRRDVLAPPFSVASIAHVVPPIGGEGSGNVQANHSGEIRRHVPQRFRVTGIDEIVGHVRDVVREHGEL